MDGNARARDQLPHRAARSAGRSPGRRRSIGWWAATTRHGPRELRTARTTSRSPWPSEAPVRVDQHEAHAARQLAHLDVARGHVPARDVLGHHAALELRALARSRSRGCRARRRAGTGWRAARLGAGVAQAARPARRERHEAAEGADQVLAQAVLELGLLEPVGIEVVAEEHERVDGVARVLARHRARATARPGSSAPQHLDAACRCRRPRGARAPARGAAAAASACSRSPSAARASRREPAEEPPGGPRRSACAGSQRTDAQRTLSRGVRLHYSPRPPLDGPDPGGTRRWTASIDLPAPRGALPRSRARCSPLRCVALRLLAGGSSAAASPGCAARRPRRRRPSPGAGRDRRVEGRARGGRRREGARPDGAQRQAGGGAPAQDPRGPRRGAQQPAQLRRRGARRRGARHRAGGRRPAHPRRHARAIPIRRCASR